MMHKIKNEYIPTTVSHPGETLLDLLEERGISQAELAERTGRPKKTINEIIRGKSGIIPETAIQLERVLRVPARFWLERQRHYDEFIARKIAEERLRQEVDWLKTIPIAKMISMGWVRKNSDKAAQLNEVLTFFGVNSPDEWRLLWRRPQVVYRKSSVFKHNPEATSAWLRKGELEAQQILCNEYDESEFRIALSTIRSLTRHTPDRFIEEVVSRCAVCGVAVVFIPPLPKVRIYGVTRWITPRKALIQLSLRGRFEDLLWFTFFHESGHILIHGKRDVFIEEGGIRDKDEQEADTFARDFLIPPEKFAVFTRNSKYISKAQVLSFAKQLDISPAIVAGRLQHERILPRSHMNDLRRRYQFVNELG